MTSQAVQLPLTLVQRRPRAARFALIWLVFFGIGIWMIATDPASWRGWWVAGFFGFSLVFSAASIIAPGRLTLTAEGFQVTVPFRRAAVKLTWSECSHFKPWQNPFAPQQLVAFKCTGEDPRWNGRRHRVSKSLTRGTAALPDLYGKSAKELADLMNDLKARYGD